ncbi:MAG: hypothetical protein Q8P24_09710 [Desulfobacterales bacterium]|nr:hypothetical protein [Desulfobacterales bacterium]
MLWYELKNLEKSGSSQISADIFVPPDSPWFCGHFPGEPILPGIAQLGMVYDAISQSGDRNLEISNISRVRFKQMIRPNDQLNITVQPRNDRGKSYSFRIMVAGKVACSGVMALENPAGKSGE